MNEPPDDTPGESLAPEELLTEGAAQLLAGVEQLGPAWVERAVEGIVSAWGRLDDETLARTRAAAVTAGRQATDRVLSELRALFALDPAAQRVTPLEVIRSLRREATAVLADAGIPPVERDEFDERAFPDDVYAIVLKSVVELGDEDLGPALLAWGMGKAKVLRSRANPP